MREIQEGFVVTHDECLRMQKFKGKIEGITDREGFEYGNEKCLSQWFLCCEPRESFRRKIPEDYMEVTKLVFGIVEENLACRCKVYEEVLY